MERGGGRYARLIVGLVRKAAAAIWKAVDRTGTNILRVDI